MYTRKIAGKVNLSLEITGNRDGYHTLDMLICGVSIYDIVTYFPSESGELALMIRTDQKDIDIPRFSEYLKGIIQKITEYIKEINKNNIVSSDFKIAGELEIEKQVPLAGGLGGSTASIVGIAGVLSDYASSLGLKSELSRDFLIRLGADSVVLSKGGFCRVQGIGESVEELTNLDCSFLILKPMGGVDSKECYKKFDKMQKNEYDINENFLREKEKTQKSEDAYEFLKKVLEYNTKSEKNRPIDTRNCDLYKKTKVVLGEIRNKNMIFENHLEKPAMKINQNIKTAKKALVEVGCKYILLSGSGSSYIAVVENNQKAKDIAQKLKFDGQIIIANAQKR